ACGRAHPRWPPWPRPRESFVLPSLGANSRHVPRLHAPLECRWRIDPMTGTTIAPWQLFFQQSYVVDKRITPRFIRYERLDLWLGIVLVVMGGVAMMGFTAATFAGRPEFGHFADAGAVAAGMQKYFGRTPGVLFALALIDAC